MEEEANHAEFASLGLIAGSLEQVVGVFKGTITLTGVVATPSKGLYAVPSKEKSYVINVKY